MSQRRGRRANIRPTPATSTTGTAHAVEIQLTCATYFTASSNARQAVCGFPVGSSCNPSEWFGPHSISYPNRRGWPVVRQLANSRSAIGTAPAAIPIRSDRARVRSRDAAKSMTNPRTTAATTPSSGRIVVATPIVAPIVAAARRIVVASTVSVMSHTGRDASASVTSHAVGVWFMCVAPIISTIGLSATIAAAARPCGSPYARRAKR